MNLTVLIPLIGSTTAAMVTALVGLYVALRGRKQDDKNITESQLETMLRERGADNTALRAELKEARDEINLLRNRLAELQTRFDRLEDVNTNLRVENMILKNGRS